jgi:hypothetical protein
MNWNRLRESALPRTVADVAADFADLFQKELKLTRTELSSKLKQKVRGGIWVIAAAGFGILAALLTVQAAVFGIAALGVPLHWSSLIVAAVMGAVGAACYLKGRGDIAEELAPTRTIEQVNRDIATIREQLS